MEAFVPGMEEEKKLEEAKLTSAAAFVEGGIQEACDDACSICLDEFCESEPSTVTGCKHEFHLQCILEWCQRSSQCPMCWQPIGLKDPTSQELFDAVIQERNLRLNPPRNAARFHHPALGDFEIQHSPVGLNDAELEERIIQHLAAMGRTRYYGRRVGHRARSSTQGRQRFRVFSSNPSAQVGAPYTEGGLGESFPTSSIVTPSSPIGIGGEASPSTFSPNHLNQRDFVSASGNSALAAIRHSQASPSNNGMSSSQSSPRSQDSAGPSDLHLFSESLKSRLNTMSMRYKESISKSTRGWKERWFPRNSTTSNIGSEVQGEMNAGIATVSQMMERLETSDNERIGNDSSLHTESISAPDASNQHRVNSIIDPGGNHLNENCRQAPCAPQSGSV